jgi:hypothetical protein
VVVVAHGRRARALRALVRSCARTDTPSNQSGNEEPRSWQWGVVPPCSTWTSYSGAGGLAAPAAVRRSPPGPIERRDMRCGSNLGSTW